jgi:hypothetical protein
VASFCVRDGARVIHSASLIPSILGSVTVVLVVSPCRVALDEAHDAIDVLMGCVDQE